MAGHFEIVIQKYPPEAMDILSEKVIALFVFAQEDEIRNIRHKCLNCPLYDSDYFSAKIPNCEGISGHGGAALRNSVEITRENFSSVYGQAVCGLNKSKNIHVFKR